MAATETTAALIKMFVGINMVDNSEHMGIIVMSSDGRLRASTRAVTQWLHLTFTAEIFQIPRTEARRKVTDRDWSSFHPQRVSISKATQLQSFTSS